jgi:hypothetical protein
MKKEHEQNPLSAKSSARGTRTPHSGMVTTEERRRAFEVLAATSFHPLVDLDARLFETLAHEVVEPRAELFPGEMQALVAVVINEQDRHSFAGRVLAQAALEVAGNLDEGTLAGRTSVLRSIAGFLLHYRCTQMAAERRRGRRRASRRNRPHATRVRPGPIAEAAEQAPAMRSADPPDILAGEGHAHQRVEIGDDESHPDATAHPVRDTLPTPDRAHHGGDLRRR